MSFDEERDETPQEDEVTGGPPEAEQAAEEQPEAEQPAEEAEQVAEQQPEAEQPAEEQPEAEQPAEQPPEVEASEPSDAEEPPRERPKRDRKKKGEASEPELIPGAHLEPDLVLEDVAGGPEGVGEQTAAEIQAAEAALAEADGEAAVAEEPAEEQEQPEPAAPPTTVLELAADARYFATGKRKSAVARVTLKPGNGAYTINGRELERFFPRPTLQKVARGPLETVGQEERMDVVAHIHGGGVSAQAGALRHGVARALVEADPNLRGELKRRGFLTRDPRVKERKKAGLKKARKRPQFSKR